MSNPTRILVVDDDKKLATTIGDLLSQAAEAYDVSLAFDGEQAISSILNQKFDVVILDLVMPKAGGLGILKLLKSAAPDTKVLILSGHTAAHMEECSKLGADAMVPKPYDIEVLFSTIEKLLGVST
jgi:DNA-binding response OmpR family regulator